MLNIYEKTLAQFCASCNNLAKASDSLALEDARFVKFTELLEIGNIIANPTICRYSGGQVNQPWSLLGYSWTEERNRVSEEFEDNEAEDEDEKYVPIHEFESTYRYTFIHGFFEGDKNLRNAKKIELERSINHVTRFVSNTIEKQNKSLVKDEHDVHELQNILIDSYRKKKIDKIDFLIITDTIIQQEDLIYITNIKGYDEPCTISYWDIKRWSELKQSKSKREPVNFSFEAMGYPPAATSSSIACPNNISTCFLSILPGGLVADLYDDFHTRLLESNVRVFLSLKRQTNKDMIDTINTDPEMFLSYNNGLSATASSISLDSNGAIKTIQDFQIVNGGQTTATLYHAKKRLKKSLQNVHVQLKLTVIKDANIREKIVPKISRFANSQTAIRPSDFEANHAYLIDIVKISGKTYVTRENGTNKYYFFERMAGQYNEDKSRLNNSTHIREWERKFPPEWKFDKIDLGRWSNIMWDFPHIAALSAEKSFSSFIDRVNNQKIQVNQNIFKDLLGFGVLFRHARKLCGTKKGKKNPSIIGDSSVAMATTIYAMALFHRMSKGKFDYHLIFEDKLNIEELDDFLKFLIKSAWGLLEKFGGSSVQEQSKKLEAWQFVKNNFELNHEQLILITPYLISDKDILERQQGEVNETYQYFALLDKYFGNHASLFIQLYNSAHIDVNYIRIKTLVRNIRSQLEKQDSKISLSRLAQLEEFYKYAVRNKSDIRYAPEVSESLNINIDFENLYRLVFSDPETCLENLEQKVLNCKDDEFDRLSDLYSEIKDAVEDYHSSECFSISELIQLQKNLTQISKA